MILAVMALCFLPFIRYGVQMSFGQPIPWVMIAVYCLMYIYVWVSCIVSLIQGIGKKQWEARAILFTCTVPVALFLLTFIVFAFVAAVRGVTGDNDVMGTILFKYFTKTIVFIYTLAAVFILAKRNAINQKKLQAQVISIRQLSEENMAKEIEKQKMLEGQRDALEREVSLRTAEIVSQKEEIEKQHSELKIEKRKSDDLLRNILPEEVAEELKEKGFSEARLFDNVTVLFADFVDFTKAGEAMRPQELVNELHICFKNFDEIISRYNIEKIKTIGDAYLAVSGLPVADAGHAEHVVNASLEILRFMKDRQRQMGGKTFHVRIGIHSGSVVAGIVGVKKFAYDIWGDAVNTAARMEQNCEPDKINLSQTTYELVKDKFDCLYRGEIDAKNKGMMKMYYVNA